MVFTAMFCISTDVICCRCHNMVFPVSKHAQFVVGSMWMQVFCPKRQSCGYTTCSDCSDSDL